MSKFYVLCLLSVAICSQIRADQLCLTVRVKDVDGRPVTNATAVVKALNKVGFNAGAVENDYTRFTAMTDSNGVAKVVFNTPGIDIVAWVVADNCYSDVPHRVAYKAKSRMLYWADFEEREKELSVVLYPKRNPTAMFSHCVDLGRRKIPKGIGRFGFDLKLCDWISPWGKGEDADFYFVRGSKGDEWSLSFDGRSGLYKEANEGNRYSPSTYEAKTNASFISELHISGPICDGERTVLSRTEHFVLRTRVVCDETGRIVKANYSKIDGEFAVGRYIRFHMSVFNPNVNDTNLEVDMKRNLAKGRFRAR